MGSRDAAIKLHLRSYPPFLVLNQGEFFLLPLLNALLRVGKYLRALSLLSTLAAWVLTLRIACKLAKSDVDRMNMVWLYHAIVRVLGAIFIIYS